jgi:hypothetical protein
VNEALTQAKLTAQFQADYLDRYGRLARVPVPLLVVRWPEKFRSSLVETLRPLLAPTSFDNLLRVTEPGLGALVYYYPSLPLRASSAAPDRIAELPMPGHLPGERTGASFAERLDKLRERVEPAETVHQWIDLLVDMLFLGYFPFDTYCMGHCLQAHNLCIDGGCADTDSLVAMSTIGDDRYFNELFLHSSLELALAISRYLRGTWEPNHANYVIIASVWEELHGRLRERLAEGERCDPRLERIMKGTGFFARLELFLGSILPGGVTPRGEIWA